MLLVIDGPIYKFGFNLELSFTDFYLFSQTMTMTVSFKLKRDSKHPRDITHTRQVARIRPHLATSTLSVNCWAGCPHQTVNEARNTTRIYFGMPKKTNASLLFGMV